MLECDFQELECPSCTVCLVYFHGMLHLYRGTAADDARLMSLPTVTERELECPNCTVCLAFNEPGDLVFSL